MNSQVRVDPWWAVLTVWGIVNLVNLLQSAGFLSRVITGNTILIVLSAGFLSIIAFTATSTWALFGTGIRTYLHKPRLKTLVNITMSLFLVYVAVKLL